VNPKKNQAEISKADLEDLYARGQSVIETNDATHLGTVVAPEAQNGRAISEMIESDRNRYDTPGSRQKW
jgi:hypothetical protein